MTRRVLPLVAVVSAVLVATGLLAWWALRGSDAVAPGAAPGATESSAERTAPRRVPKSVSDASAADVRRTAPRASAPRARARKEPTERIRGLVVGEGDAPLAGAKVRLQVAAEGYITAGGLAFTGGFDLDAPPRPPAAETTTSAEGRFEFPIGAEERWRIDVVREDAVVGSVSGQGPGEWRIVAGVGLQTATLLLFDSATGVGIAGARFLLWGESTELPPIRTFVTSEDGTASLSLVGNELVLAVADGYRPAVLPVDASQSPCRIPLTRAAAIRGVVVDSEGAPVEGAAVLARNVIEVNDESPIRVVTDATGRFRLPGGAATGLEADVQVVAEGFARWRRTARPGDELKVVLERLGVVEGEVVDAEGRPADNFASYGLEFPGGRFRLESMDSGILWVGGTAWWGEVSIDVGRYVVLRPGETLRGVRLAPDERRGSEVRLRIEVPEEARDAFIVVKLRTPDGEDLAEQVTEPSATDEQHVVEFGALDLPAGTPLVASASRQDAGGDAGELALIESAPVEVRTWDVAPPEIPTLVVTRPLYVRLRLVDGAGDEIEVEPNLVEVSSGPARVSTGSLLLAPDARFRLHVVVDGFRAHDAEHAAGDARDGVLTIALDAGESIRGRFALEPDAVPRSEADVLRGRWEFRVLQGAVERSFRPADDLTFEVPGLDVGPATLRVIEGNPVLYEATVRVAPGGTDVGVVRVPPFVIVPVRLTDAKGRPIAGAMLVQLDDESGDFSVSGDDGLVDVLVPRGRRTVVRAWDETRSSRATWVAGAADAAPVDVRLEPCARLVVRSGDRPLAAGEITLSARTEDGADLRLDASKTDDERFTVANFPPGRAVLKVTWRGRTTEHTVDAAPGAFVEVDVGR